MFSTLFIIFSSLSNRCRTADEFNMIFDIEVVVSYNSIISIKYGV